MASWDYTVDVEEILDKLNELTGLSYVLLMAYSDEETGRATHRSIINLEGEVALGALDDAASKTFSDAYAHYGLDEDGDAA